MLFFDSPQSKGFTRYQKILWRSLFGCINLLNITCLTMKFHNCHHLLLQLYNNTIPNVIIHIVFLWFCWSMYLFKIYPCKCANPWVAWRKIVRLSSLKGLVYFPVTYSYKVAQQYSNAMYRNWRSCSMQKYLTTLGCSSDSLRSSTSRSAIVKHAAKTLFTATSRLSNLPLKRIRVGN